MPLQVLESRSRCHGGSAQVFCYGDETDAEIARPLAITAALAWAKTKGMTNPVVLGLPRRENASKTGVPLAELLNNADRELPNGTAVERNEHVMNAADGRVFPSFVVDLTQATA